MALYPTCARCAEMGFITATAIIDHKTPLAMGGPDTDENTQGLCLEHDAEKTAAEDASHAGAANHPLWLQRSRIPLTIVCGPPGAGKSTWVDAHAGALDTVIDLDRITQRLTGRPGHHRGTAHLDAAIRVRNAMLGGLARSQAPRAFFIVSAPAPAERQWWTDKLGGDIVLVDPGQSTCQARILDRGTPWLTQAVADWYRRAKAPWSPPEVKREAPDIRLDGTPEGWGDE